MIAEAQKISSYDVIGVVIFSRIKNYPDWIHPIFEYWGNF